MLLIRKSQMMALQLDADLRWYESRLCSTYPAFAAAPAGQRSQWVRQGVERATAAGLGRPQMLQFLSFEQTFHPDCLDDAAFDWARVLLGDPNQDAEQRMKNLRHESVRRLLDAEARQEQAALAAAEEAEQAERDEQGHAAQAGRPNAEPSGAAAQDRSR
jgi:hypothetical protein